MPKSLLKNETYNYCEGDLPPFIENKLKKWNGNTVETFLYMDPSSFCWKDNQKDRSLVYAIALMPNPDLEVLYEIRWDAQGVPGGNHLGQRPNVAQDAFIVDLDQEGKAYYR